MSDWIKLTFNIGLIVGFTCFITIKGILPGWGSLQSDFSNYYVASKLLADGAQIQQFYNSDWFLHQAKNIEGVEYAQFAPFTPVTAYLYLPLSIFSPLVAKRVWLLINLIFLVVVVFQIMRLTNKKLLSALTLLAFFWYPVASNLRLGQCYLLLVTVILFALNAASRSPFISGLALSLVSGLKIFPVFYMLEAVLKRNYKLVYGFVITVIIVLMWLYITEGVTLFQLYLPVLTNMSGGNYSGMDLHSYALQSWDAIFSNLFVYDSIMNPNPYINNSDLKTVFKLLLLAGLVSSLYWVRRVKQRDGKIDETYFTAVSVLGFLVVMPIVPSYLLLLVLPAIAIIITRLDYYRPTLLYKGGWYMMLFMAINAQFHHLPLINSEWQGQLWAGFPRVVLLSLFFVWNLILFKTANGEKSSVLNAR